MKKFLALSLMLTSFISYSAVLANEESMDSDLRLEGITDSIATEIQVEEEEVDFDSMTITEILSYGYTITGTINTEIGFGRVIKSGRTYVNIGFENTNCSIIAKEHISEDRLLKNGRVIEITGSGFINSDRSVITAGDKSLKGIAVYEKPFEMTFSQLKQKCNLDFEVKERTNLIEASIEQDLAEQNA